MKLLVVLFVCFLLAFPVQAKIEGYVAVDYDTLNEDWAWSLGVDKHITDWFLVGTTMTTMSPTYVFKHFIPSWVPHRLDYEVYAEVRLGDWSLRVTDWCDHWFSQSYHWGEDEWGLKVRLKYEF